MAPVLQRSRDNDHVLAQRVSSGDGGAFATLDARHRSALTRYAGTLLRRSEHDAEDVVQDVLIRAHQALRAGDVPDELRPWLYRLTRNRAIDEVRRKRWGDESLDPEHSFTGPGREEPESVLRHKETLRRLVEDLADLPVRQRHALLARELDDQTPEQIAARLGVSVMATHKLASRARENLVKTRDARDADCLDIRAALLDADELRVRPTEHALRHVKGCDTCRAYQRDVRRLSKQLHALNPTLGLPLLASLAKLVAGGSAKTATAVVAAVALAATGGIVVLKSEVHSPGEPAPFQLLTFRDSKGRTVTRGQPIPEGLTVVTARIRLPAGPSTLHKDASGHYPGLTLPCPKDMKYAGLQFPNRQLPAYVDPLGDAIPGYSTGVRFRVTHRGLAHPVVFTIGINCRRLDAYGSLLPVTPAFRLALKRGERRLAHVCTTSFGVNVRDTPGGRAHANIERGWPAAIQRRSRSGTWTRVMFAPDATLTGWIKTRELCN
jgi:RNA polymerase sigma factor (sigma-70 family)